MTEDRAVRRAFEVVEVTPEAAAERDELIDILLRHNPRLLFSLLSGAKPQAKDLTRLFADQEQGRFFRALLVALKYLGWSQEGLIPDLTNKDLRLIDSCWKDGVTRLLASRHYYQRMVDADPEFLHEFDFFLTRCLFMNEVQRDLTLIIVGRLWEKKMVLDALGWILVVVYRG